MVEVSSELRMNVAAIKRFDPYVKDIIDSAKHVALYSFNREENSWEKTEIEGALFVYSRNGQPQNNIIIMNRLNLNNLVEPIIQKLDLQLQAPFLLYRNSRCRIYGIWFYDKDECVKIASLLENIIQNLGKTANNLAQTEQKNPISQSNTSVNIFSMLSKAQEEFKNGNTPRPPDVTSQSVMDFFAKASSGTTGVIQKIISNPVHSVEQIEKLVRETTPAEKDVEEHRDGSQILEKSLGNLILKTPDKLAKSSSPPPSIKQKLQQIVANNCGPPGTQGLNLIGQQSSSSNVSVLIPGPALMPPTMFIAGGNNNNSGEPPQSSVVSINSTQVSTTTTVMVPPEPLTKNQFISAFTYLIRNDPEFVNKLHEAYVKSFSELVS